MTENTEDALRRELIGVQEMLGQVLKQVAEPIRVTKASLAEGVPPGTQISIDEEEDAFVFYLQYPEAE